MASKPKVPTITIRCQEDWKRKVKSAAALRGVDLETMCVEAISRYLKIQQEAA